MQRLRAAVRYAPAAGALVVGVVLSCVVYYFAMRAEHERLDARFRADGLERVNAVRGEILDDLQRLDSVAALFDASIEVNREEFAAFARRIRPQLDTVEAVAWVPHVSHALRDAQVAWVRAEGFPRFDFTELSPGGGLRPAAARAEYFPVVYVEPYAGNERILGFDLASESTRREALQRARDTGELSLSGRITLVQSPAADLGFLALLPVFHGDAMRENPLRGFVVGVLRIDRIVDKALSAFAPRDLQVRILDLSAAPGERLVYASPVAEAVDEAAFNLRQDVAVGGRRWRIDAIAGPGHDASGRDWVAWALLASGLLVTTVISLYLLSALRRTAQIEHTVTARTAELSQANERLKQEIARRRSAQRGQQRFFTLSLDMLCIAGTDGYFKELNPAWTSVLGYSLDELKARPFIEFVHPDDRQATEAQARRLTEGQDVVSFENRYLCKDGSHRWLLWSAAADRRDRIILAVARDITERKHVEEIKSEFVSTVSHELRTPLTSIRGSLGLLQSGVAGTLTDKARSLVDIAASNCDRLVRLVNDILDVEKIESGRIEWKVQVLDIAEAVREAVSAMSAFTAQQRVTIDVPHRMPSIDVVGDRDRIVQVMTNLLSNAVKFSPPGARVDVQLARPSPGRARVTVRDRGPGVATEHRSRIFEPFVQAGTRDGANPGGTGLGLSIARSIVDHLGGHIGHEPAEGGGSRFYFELPVAAEHGAATVVLEADTAGDGTRTDPPRAAGNSPGS